MERGACLDVLDKTKICCLYRRKEGKREGTERRGRRRKLLLGKGKVHPRTGHEITEGEKRYSSNLSLTSALDGVGGQRHAPADLPTRKTRHPLYKRLGGPQGRSGRMWKISPPLRFDPRTVHPVAIRYTD